MAIPTELLKSTWGRALGLCTYGGPGLKKTLGIHTLPPPIYMDDTEGGSVTIMPWVRRGRKWNESTWTEFSDQDRQEAYELLNEESKQYISKVTRIVPRPYIDVVWWDSMDAHAYEQLKVNLAQFPYQQYSSYAHDSIQEGTALIKAMAKGAGREMDAMATSLWGGVQDRAASIIRTIKNLRDKGVFVYITCSEQIDKDYVTDPRGQKPGQEEAPYAVKGTVNVNGGTVQVMQHCVDIMLHAKQMGLNSVWVKRPEPISNSGAQWEAKDRTGRIKQDYCPTNWRVILTDIYGEERRKAIYAAGTQSGT